MHHALLTPPLGRFLTVVRCSSGRRYDGTRGGQMISARLVHLIESNGQKIVDRAMAQIHREPEVSHSRSLLEYEMREMGQALTHDLGTWLSSSNGQDPAVRCERLGKLCWEHNIPIAEAFQNLCLMREKMLE